MKHKTAILCAGFGAMLLLGGCANEHGSMSVPKFDYPSKSVSYVNTLNVKNQTITQACTDSYINPSETDTACRYTRSPKAQ